MDVNKYIEQTASTAVYSEAGTGSIPAVAYVALGLVNEAGEVGGKIKKFIRGDDGDHISEERRDAITDELGDVMWYIARLCEELDISFDEVLQRNMDKLASRKERGVIKGDGDKR